MSISIEALAMAGVEYVEWGMDVEEWEREDSDAPPPPHLLAEEEEGDDDDADGETSGGVTLDYRSRRTGKGRSSVRVIERMCKWLTCMKMMMLVLMMMRKRLIKPFVAAPFLITN
ncbi:hypothetical protein ACOSP7_021712 [Xanthoceras sorbifolium]